MTEFLFACHRCSRHEFSIRGLCAGCAPREEHKRRMAEYEVVCLQYLRETGKRPLSDWDAFEDWCAEHDRR